MKKRKNGEMDLKPIFIYLGCTIVISFVVAIIIAKVFEKLWKPQSLNNNEQGGSNE